MNRSVLIVTYDPRWPEMYHQEKQLIRSAVGDKILGIEHVGSTAVPGLGAKPIIDIIAGVGDLDMAGECVGPLAGIGYEFLLRTNPPVPDRRYFRKRKQQIYHLHMCVYRNSFWTGLILFRDYLRAHAEVAKEYYEFKKLLAEKYRQDRLAYTVAKTEYIEGVVQKARKERL